MAGKRLSPSAKRARDRLIREEREQGATLEQLASRYGIAVSTVKEAIDSANAISAEEQLADLDPSDDLVAILDAQRDALATLVREMAQGDNSASRVGAAKATAPAGQALRDTLAAAGCLPGRVVNPMSTGEALTLDRVWKRAVNAMLDIAKRQGIDSNEVEAELDRALEEATS
jgi:hypothetical protein